MEYKDCYAQEHLQKYSDHDSSIIIDKKDYALVQYRMYFHLHS
jgi:hypothetical protein